MMRDVLERIASLIESIPSDRPRVLLDAGSGGEQAYRSLVGQKAEHGVYLYSDHAIEWAELTIGDVTFAAHFTRPLTAEESAPAEEVP